MLVVELEVEVVEVDVVELDVEVVEVEVVELDVLVVEVEVVVVLVSHRWRRFINPSSLSNCRCKGIFLSPCPR